MASTTRQRILDTTAALFVRHGYTGTGLKQIVAAANAPFGSVYHHFPGGKAQLGEEVIHRSGRMYAELVTGVIDAAPDLLTGIEHAFAGAAAVMEATDYIDACPIATVALEVASSNEALRRATAEVFESWIRLIHQRLAGAGIDAGQARPLAIALIQLLEGGFMLSRAARSTEALTAAGRAAATLVAAALP
ncbi:MAG TPA: TetR/AcrR family transcriptional regulator [Candidatus Dormibacteraeota bacterium]|jgi:AcrR family transcriptional regulator|nr:TetR/AcrR family transcriptional regulator [Candidatus Dormibacteraeota bacterium]